MATMLYFTALLYIIIYSVDFPPGALTQNRVKKNQHIMLTH